MAKKAVVSKEPEVGIQLHPSLKVPLNGSKKNNNSSDKKEQIGTRTFKSKMEEFYSTLKKAENQSVLVVIKGYPDPDSIASSLAFQFIGGFYGIESTILHFDEISHQENKALVKKLGIELVQYEDGFDFSSYKYLVFNDTQTTNLPIALPEEILPLILVDHHKNL
ncbi:MAG TPA: hypothetical protein ENI73_04420, partial [Spirochaetes bacterium]|nr:hypothetical protein [Spirochaetota bacterium]